MPNPSEWEVRNVSRDRANEVRCDERPCVRLFTRLFAWSTVALVFYIVYEVGGKAMPAIREQGFSFLTTTTWNLQDGEFGVLPEIWGTLYSSILALLIGGFFGIAIAIFLTQNFLPPKIEWVFKNVVELLAAIPSVVYGLWGIFVVIPMIRPRRTAARTPRLVPSVWHFVVGSGNATRRSGAIDHDSADGLGDFAGIIE